MAPADGGLYAMGFAGDTFNTAWYARRLLPQDWTVGYATVAGTDPLSDRMCAFMQAEGLDTTHVQRAQDRTLGLYMIQLAQGERSFSYWRGQSAAKLLADDPAALDAAFAGASVIHFSGITLAILAPDARTRLCDALGRARAAGSHIAFDTNLRPRLWDSAEAMRDGLMAGAAVADTVLPSLDEESLAFATTDAADSIARYQGAGARAVVVKNGGASCLAWDAVSGTVEVAPQTVPAVVDSTAAGDSFAAGYLAARASGALLRQAVEQACGLAAQVVQQRGALAHALFDKGA